MTIRVPNIVSDVRRYLEERYSSGDVRILDVMEAPVFRDDRSIRVAWEYRGITENGEYRNMELTLERFTFMGRSEVDIAIYVAREFMRGIDEDRRDFMAQWNQRRAQQLQAQENQRRAQRLMAQALQRNAASDQAEPEPERFEGFRPQAIRSTGTRISDFVEGQLNVPRWLVDDLVGTQTTYTNARGGTTGTTILDTAAAVTGFMYNATNGIGGAGGAGASSSNTGIGAAGSSYVRGNTLTFDAAEEMFKRLLQEKLESLDIRISLDESDGEVSAEVEVVLDGKVIASDSDTITIG